MAPRKKVNLELIASDSARRAAFRKRLASLMKKAGELATLCAVDACVVVYGKGASQPEVYPSAAEAARILGRFRAMPELEQCKKMVDMVGYLQQQVDKVKEQVEKARRETHRRENALLLHDAIAGRGPGVAGLSRDELIRLVVMVDARLEGIGEALQRLKAQRVGHPATVLQLSSSLASQAPPPVQYTAGAGYSEEVQVHHAPDPEGSWFLDVSRAEGFSGDSGSFGGRLAGASTSGGLGDMLQLGNTMAGLPWADQEPSLPFPPPM